MGLLSFLLLVIIVGVLVWLAITYIPMPPAFKTALPVMAIVVLILILVLYIFGNGMHDVPIPRVR